MNGPGKRPSLPVASKGAVSAELRELAKGAQERAQASSRKQGPEEVGPPPDPLALAAMEDALMRLSGRERDVFLAVRVDSLSIEQIAERMGIPSQEALRIFVSAFGNLERNLASPRRHWWRRWIVWAGLQGWRRWWRD